MEQTIGKDILNPAERKQFLSDNADAVEKVVYEKPFTPEELEKHKEELIELSIEMESVKEKAKVAAKGFKEQLKPLKNTFSKLVESATGRRAELSIEMESVKEKAKVAAKGFKEQLKPLKNAFSKLVEEIKNESEKVCEPCYKFVDMEAKEVGYYNECGDLIKERKAVDNDFQQTMFGVIRNQRTMIEQ